MTIQAMYRQQPLTEAKVKLLETEASIEPEISKRLC